MPWCIVQACSRAGDDRTLVILGAIFSWIARGGGRLGVFGGEAVDAFGTYVVHLQRPGTLSAAMPAMGIYPMLAGRYGEGQVAAAAMLTMTVLSFVTANILIFGLGDG
jgi:hypothetical protein